MNSLSRTGLCLLIILSAAAPSRAGESPAANPPPKAKPLEVNSAPLVRSWTPGVFPAGVEASVPDGSAVVRIVVDDKGSIASARVLEASKPAFGDAALAAVRQWAFSPALDEGKPIAMCMDVPFEFSRDSRGKPGLLPPERLMPRPAARSEASLENGPLREYPGALVGRGLPGEVQFACKVGADGTATDFKLLYASHVEFVTPVLQSVPSWRFTPARQGDLTVVAVLRGEVSYSDSRMPPRAKVLAANGITAPDGSEPDPAPQPVDLADPVWPYDLLLAGKEGSATVEFTVLASGYTRDVRVREATDPAFAAALAAVVPTWRFDGAMRNGQGVDVRLAKKAEFKIAAHDPEVTRLLELARQGPISGRATDAPVTPLYRVAPVRPVGLPENQKGEAVIEFIIDRGGRTRLVRVVSATNEDVGAAAALAMSQWVFKAPTRGGAPADVRVQIPVRM